jgi:rubrerythrin
MQEKQNNEYIHYPPFRPSLRGCIGRDVRMAAAVYTCCSEAFFSISDNIYRSLVCRDSDTALAELFEEIAERDLERFRTLGELFLALSNVDGRKTVRYPYFKRNACPTRCHDSLATAALWERRRNIDCYETLLGRTEDRVVRSIFTKLLSTERLLCHRLEAVCST